MKARKDNKNVAGYLMVTIIMIAAVFFMHRVTGILELQASRGARNVVSETFAVNTNQIAIVACSSNDCPKLQDKSSAIMEAYESLSNELSSWMAIMGIFAAVFGLVIPLGSFLLQHQSLKDERESIMKDVEKVKERYAQLDNVEGRLKKTESQCRVIENAVNGTCRSFWKAIGRCFEYAVITNKYAGEQISMTPSAEIANLILSIELDFDCCILAHDKDGLVQQISYVRMILCSLLKNHNDELKDAYDLLKKDRRQRTELVKGFKYLELLGSDNEQYKWLKSLFDKFDNDKLP